MIRQFVVAFLFVGFGLHAAAFDVGWIKDDDQIEFPNIACLDGSCDGQVEVIGPLDMVYSNTCFAAEATGGIPDLDIDHVNRTIEIEFQPTKGGCPLVFDPVAGVSGAIGPPDDVTLADGQWTLFANNPAMQFIMRFQIPADASDGTVDFIPGEDPPVSTSVICEETDCTGMIDFQIPTGVYTNSCTANLTTGGAPVLTRDDETNSVELWFAPPRFALCSLAYIPVGGLAGELGPLAPGTWSFYSENPDTRFVQIIEVGGFSRGWIPGTTAPAEWDVLCDTADCTGNVAFEGPTAQYDNVCKAAQGIDGVPNLVVDSDAKTIELVVSPPEPALCPDFIDPVAGLGGTFGDLEDGFWTFFSDSILGTFSIPFTVGEPCAVAIHSADQDGNNMISLSELLRVIQFFNSAGFGCEAATEDGYAPGDPDQECCPHLSDYAPLDWEISLSELLRLIQFFNSGGYSACPDEDPPTEDGFCPGL